MTTPIRDNFRKRDMKDTKDTTSSKTIPKETLTLKTTIPIPGYINQLQIGPKGIFVMVAVGQEPKLGRWNFLKGVKN